MAEQTMEQAVNAEKVLGADELRRMNAYWRAANYLCAGMLYLVDNPLLREPLKVEHIKQRLLGHWGSDPGQTFLWVHMNRVIKKYDLNMMYIAGPGHGAPATLSNSYLEGVYTEVYPDKTQNLEGMQRFFKQFSFPGGIGSHCTPETPGSIHEGGELGYSIVHGAGAAFDNPDLIVTVMVGDGESETGPLATSWHSNKFINAARDGAVLPVLHLNGYKIANPTIPARIPEEELAMLLRGYGWEPRFVSGDDPDAMHELMAATMDGCVEEIHRIQADARKVGAAKVERAKWPMIVLRSPKGWTGPKYVDGHKVEGFWRAHQIPILDPRTNPKHLKQVEEWMRSYRPEELFDESGRLIAELASLPPEGARRVSANPHANGGVLRKPLQMPAFRDYAVAVDHPGKTSVSPTDTLAHFLRDVMRGNMNSFRVFGPDETASNKLQVIYEASQKTWLEQELPEDTDGSDLQRDGRVMEMLSETTLEGWFEGYVLTGRHGFFSSYEAFVHIIDSMYNQHAKWLEKSKALKWRAPISSINLLITSLVWRQDHNGFTHQDPGFLDVVTNKSPEITRIYLPPDANCLLSTADHCLRSTDYVNVIVADKQEHLQYLTMDEAVLHCTKGIGIWDFASTDCDGSEPDVVMACAGDIPTSESLAAVAILRERCPELKIRFVNVVDLFKLMPSSQHPHGMSDNDFDSLFTKDKPVIFNFHAYPWLIHKLTYKRTNHANMHVHGYIEKGNINTPLELAIENQVDRFHLAIAVIDRVPKLQATASHLKEWLRDQIIESIAYSHANGIDKEEIRNWMWPF